MVAEIAGLEQNVPPLLGIQLLPVLDEPGVDAMVQLHDDVFGGDNSRGGQCRPRSRGSRHPPWPVITWSEGAAAAAGRVEFQPGTDFAASGVAAPCRHGVAAECSARWWLARPRWARLEGSVGCRSTPLRRVDPSCGASVRGARDHHPLHAPRLTVRAPGTVSLSPPDPGQAD
jgi:hypothetical protein